MTSSNFIVKQSTAQAQPLLRTIRLNDEQIDKLQDHLGSEDNPATLPPGSPKLFPYRIKGLTVTIDQPGGSPTPYQVAGHAIGENHLSFLHGGFIHIGTFCVAQLISTYGAWENANGIVLSCRYIDKGIHEVLIRLESSINVALFSKAAIQPRILLAEDETISAKLALFHLSQLNAAVDHVENGAQAVEKALKTSYDLILMDIEMPVMDGFAAVKELRSKGYTGTVVAVTMHTQDEIREKCLEAGFDRYTPKPYSYNDLENLIGAVLEEPLYSTIADQPGMDAIITAFVEDLPARVRIIEQALIAKDVKKIELAARQLKGDGTGCGFEAISSIAAEVEKALVGGASIDSIFNQIAKLNKLCSSARQTGK